MKEAMAAENRINRDQALDGIRGVAILLVMLGHCIVLNGLDQTDPFLYDIIKSVQMPLFLLISGYVSAGGKLRYTKLPRRAQSYLVPFFSWFVAAYFLARCRDMLQGKEITISLSDLVGELKALLFQTDRGLWFFMTLFVITLLMTAASELSLRFCRGHIMGTLALAGVFYVLVFLWSRTGNTFLSPSLTLQYMPFYVLGLLRGSLAGAEGKSPDTAQQASLLRQRIGKAEPYAAALCLAVFLFLVIRYPLAKPASSGSELILQMLASLLGTVGLFGTLYPFFSSTALKKRGLSFLGLYTSEIYVLHFRFARLLDIGRRTDTIWSFGGMLWLLLAFLLMSILTAGFIFVLDRIPVCRFLLFGKRKSRRPSGKVSKG